MIHRYVPCYVPACAIMGMGNLHQAFKGSRTQTRMPKVDVVIAGGGAVGSATAYFLTERTGFAGTVAVVEPDPTYHFAASARSAASIRPVTTIAIAAMRRPFESSRFTIPFIALSPRK